MIHTFDPWLTAGAACAVAGAAALSEESIRILQQLRLKQLVRAASGHSEWYRRRFRGLDVGSLRLEDLPVARKEALMAHFDEWVTDQALALAPLRDFVADRSRIGHAYMDRYVVWASSGSTGCPAIFVQDAASMAIYDALQMLRQPWPNPRRRWLDPAYAMERTAFIGATDEHAASTVWLERARRLNPLSAASIRCMSFLQPRADLLRALQEFRPTVLSTYPGVAVELALEAASGRLDLSLQEIWMGGEHLTPATRRLLARTFRCDIVSSYGASEFFCLAFECRLGHLHLNSDWVILEPVDAHHRPVPSGQTSHTTLLTNLANHVQPLIRYDLGDRVRLREAPCACGSALPVIHVEGRCDDALELDMGGPEAVCIDPLALTTVLEDAGILDFQLVQTGASTLELRTASTPDGAAPQQGLAALSAYLLGQGVHDVQITCSGERPMASPRSGKIRRVIAWHRPQRG